MFDYRKDSNYLQLSALERHTIDIISLVIKGDEATVKSAIAALTNRRQQISKNHAVPEVL